MKLETITYRNHTIDIHSDDAEQINPRTEYDNLGTMVCFHKRYNLGDKNHGVNNEDYDSWDEMKKGIIKENNVAVILPIFLYDHSGLTINTTGFSCPWDSGQIGFIFITKEKVKKEYSAKIVHAELKKKVTEYLKNEVETYDKYLRGEYYGYTINKGNQEDIDSCWGFDDRDYMIKEAKRTIDGLTEKVTIDTQTVGFVEITALVPKSWVCWFYQLISDSAPFSWGDNNRTIVTASRFHEYCCNCLDDVVEDPPIDSEEAPTQEEIDTFLETVKGLGETYIDLEN